MATAQISIRCPDHSVVPPNVTRLGRSPLNHSVNSSAAVFDIARRHASDRRFVAAGTELFMEGDASDKLYIVLDGWLVLHRILEDGRRQILDFALPGAAIGYRARSDSPFSFSAEALTDAKIATIPLARVADLLREGSDCAITILEAVHEALLGAFDSLTDIGCRTAREAVGHFLLRMDRRIRQTVTPNEDGSIPFPLTQEHIGDALGLTSVHVCRTLRALRLDGLVESGRGRLRIINMTALAQDAGALSLDLGYLKPSEIGNFHRSNGIATRDFRQAGAPESFRF